MRTDGSHTAASAFHVTESRCNLAFKDWPSVFPNATCATALIDRVIHHADVIGIEGKSYRLREAEDAAKKDGPKPKK
jgi:DNA replication protein DnaC